MLTRDISVKKLDQFEFRSLDNSDMHGLGPVGTVSIDLLYKRCCHRSR